VYRYPLIPDALGKNFYARNFFEIMKKCGLFSLFRKRIALEKVFTFCTRDLDAMLLEVGLKHVSVELPPG